MSDKMNFDFEEIMKMSADMDIIDEKDIVTEKDIEELGIPMPPADMKERIMKACANPEKKPGRSTRKIIKTVLIAAILAVALCATVVSGVRVYLYNIESRVTDNSIEFRGVNENAYSYDTEESNAYADAEEALGTTILKPTYLPEGYTFDRIKVYPNDYVSMVYKNENKSIRINQSLLQNQTTSVETVDEKDGSSYTIDMNGTKIFIGEHKQLETKDKWLSAVWNDENLTYKVEGNCTKDELIKFIKKLK